MTEHKTYILVEITNNAPIKKTIAISLPARLAQEAYGTILARGGDCVDAKAKIVYKNNLTFIAPPLKYKQAP